MGQTDELDSVKYALKRLLGRFYYRIGVTVVAPTFPFNFRKHIRRRLNQDAVVIDLGSGNHRIDPHVITLDGVGYDAVDIVADLQALPFRSESVDAFVSRSVLEHIPDLSTPIQEIKRCTRPGGYSMHLIPFLFPYHASPGDFQRFTASGAARLFAPWTVVEQYNATGPATLFLVCFIEFMATLISFGSQQLKALMYLGFCLLLFPLKFIDVFFAGRKAFLGLAPTIFTVVRKDPC
jgi:SAM-dependent methyltransferase